MPASYLGTFPVIRETSVSVVGEGVRVANAKIIAQASTASNSLPAINSAYQFDSSLWVTSADLTYTPDGLAEINIQAAGRDPDSSTTVEVQPGGPLIWGLAEFSPPAQDAIPSVFGADRGTVVRVNFVAEAGEESSIFSSYYGTLMPESINGVTLPTPIRDPGPLPEASPSITTADGNAYDLYRGQYDGFVCSDVAMRRQGKALVVQLAFKERGYVERAEFAGNTVRYVDVFRF